MCIALFANISLIIIIIIIKGIVTFSCDYILKYYIFTVLCLYLITNIFDDKTTLNFLNNKTFYEALL